MDGNVLKSQGSHSPLLPDCMASDLQREYLELGIPVKWGPCVAGGIQNMVIFFSVKTFNTISTLLTCSLMSDSATPRTITCQAPLSIFQAKILEWVAISYFRASSRPRDQTQVSCISCIGRQILYHYAMWGVKKYMCVDSSTYLHMFYMYIYITVRA